MRVRNMKEKECEQCTEKVNMQIDCLSKEKNAYIELQDILAESVPAVRKYIEIGKEIEKKDNEITHLISDLSSGILEIMEQECTSSMEHSCCDGHMYIRPEGMTEGLLKETFSIINTMKFVTVQGAEVSYEMSSVVAPIELADLLGVPGGDPFIPDTIKFDFRIDYKGPTLPEPVQVDFVICHGEDAAELFALEMYKIKPDFFEVNYLSREDMARIYKEMRL